MILTPVFIFFALCKGDEARAQEPLPEEDIPVDIKALFQKNSNSYAPLILMGTSFLVICGFYFFHLKRIMKEITAVAPIFDLAENETKIDFTIAERHDG